MINNLVLIITWFWFIYFGWLMLPLLRYSDDKRTYIKWRLPIFRKKKYKKEGYEVFKILKSGIIFIPKIRVRKLYNQVLVDGILIKNQQAQEGSIFEFEDQKVIISQELKKYLENWKDRYYVATEEFNDFFKEYQKLAERRGMWWRW